MSAAQEHDYDAPYVKTIKEEWLADPMKPISEHRDFMCISHDPARVAELKAFEQAHREQAERHRHGVHMAKAESVGCLANPRIGRYLIAMEERLEALEKENAELRRFLGQVALS